MLAGTHTAAVRVLWEFGGNDGDVAEACLLKLKETASSTQDQMKLVDVLIQTLRVHVARATAVSLGFNMLSDLVGVAGYEAIVAIGQPGAEVAIAALDAHRGHRRAVFEALKLLANVSVHDEVERNILEAGGARRAIAAMRAFPNNAPIKAAAERLLQNIGALAIVDQKKIDEVAAGYVADAMANYCRAAKPAEGEDCAVCLCRLSAEADSTACSKVVSTSKVPRHSTSLVVALPCGHQFHRACIAEWFRESARQAATRRDSNPPVLECPLCKAALRQPPAVTRMMAA